MKVFLIVWMAWSLGMYTGGPTMSITEMPSMEACKQVSSAIRDGTGWEPAPSHHYQGVWDFPKAMRTKCVQIR